MRRYLSFIALAAVAAGCSARDPALDIAPSIQSQTVGLQGAVVVHDSARNELLTFTVPRDLELQLTRFPVGKNLAVFAPSAKQDRVFALARGQQPRTKPDDERPSLTLLSGGTTPAVEKRWELDDPLTGLALDPQGEWAIVYDADGAVVNENQLLLVDLRDTSRPTIAKTIRSFGSVPQRFTFTSALTVPVGEARRFLVVQTDHEIALIDLAKPDEAEVTVPVPERADGSAGTPLEVVFDDGAPAVKDDARIAVRLESDSSVLLLQLAEPTKSGRDYRVATNVATVGGEPSAIDFVRTDTAPGASDDRGLRLAALVPSRSQAVLVDPNTSTTTQVTLDAAYTSIRRVTDAVGDQAITSDVAVLWSPNVARVAFWSLGNTAGRPYRAVESLALPASVSAVLDVPGDKYGHRKLLVSPSQEFQVLDLAARESAPLTVRDAPSPQILVAPDGERAWVWTPASYECASVEFAALSPVSVAVQRPLRVVNDVARGSGGRAAIALHGGGSSLSATVFDALKPDGAQTKFYSGLSWRGLEGELKR